RYSIEPGFDYGFVQVSPDGGATWSSLADADTNVPPAPGASAKIVANQPGLTGDSGGWRDESFDLSPYAGQTVLVAFRYATDAATTGDGWWIDDIAVGGTLLSDGSSLAGWLSPTQARPESFGGFTVQLVAYSSGGRERPAYVATL